MKVNDTKSEIAWIGSKRYSTDNIGNYRQVNLTNNYITRLLNNKNNKWTLIPNGILRSVGGLSNIRSNFGIRCLPHTLPHFYTNALSAWSDFTSVNPVTRDEVILQPLWNNRLIQNNGKSLFCSKLYNEGLICINDICDNFGHILCLSKLVDVDVFKKYF